MPSDPEQILASLLSVNHIQEDNGRCSNTRRLPPSSCHPGVVYLEPKVSREVGIPSESAFHISTLCLDEILCRSGKAIH